MVMVMMLITKIGWGAAIWMVVISAAVVVVLIIKIMIINFIVTGISIPMMNTMTR